MKLTWWHDDGIFRYRKSLIWEPFQSVQQSAFEVIGAFWERDRIWRSEAQERRDAWESVPKTEKAKPWVTEKPPIRARKAWERRTALETRAEEEYQQNLVGLRNRQPSRFRKAWLDAGDRQAGIENQTARDLVAFPSSREPDYSDLQTAGYFHESFCWTVALRSAFRLLDLLEIHELEFPGVWVHVDCPSEHPNHVGLVASASYQMGIYFAKAQAMQRVPQIHRASEMIRTRKGKFNAVGETVMQACGEMHAIGLPLQGGKASARVLQFLSDQGKAMLNPPTIIGEDAPSWKINRFINRFLRANGLFVCRTQTAKVEK